MMEKVRALPLTAYLAITAFFQDLKKDDRGLSGVVVAIMLILIAVLAVVMIWGFLSGWLEELWERITGAASALP